MKQSVFHQSTRRAWLMQNGTVALTAMSRIRSPLFLRRNTALRSLPGTACSGAWGSARDVSSSPHQWADPEELAAYAVDAAQHAGATYADARVTRTEQHSYRFGWNGIDSTEQVGIGIRALVQGYWGFAACPSGDKAAIAQSAQDAVAQAIANGQGATARTVDLGRIPAASGNWTTPIAIDPFTVPIEEKHAFMLDWLACAEKVGLAIDTIQAELHFVRQQRVVVTSDGGRFTQTLFESGGTIPIGRPGGDPNLRIPVRGIDTAGRGWELFLDARIPEQLQEMPAAFDALIVLQHGTRPVTVGRYTLVCDGATMAAALGATLGAATQLDRALGYEANAAGTSFLDDPLTMLGTFQAASPLVTMTANRSAPAQLATVKWDDEGVVPTESTLIKDGILHDYQTTREQSTWLAPYYTKIVRPIRSNGHAAAESALAITMQHMPNLSLEPNAASVGMADLIATVKDGVLIEGGTIFQIDSQLRSGLLIGQLRKIQNGQLAHALGNGAVLINTLDFWRRVTAVGGASTRAIVPVSQYPYGGLIGQLLHRPVKGQPPQAASYSIQAVAATVTDQPIINPIQRA